MTSNDIGASWLIAPEEELMLEIWLMEGEQGKVFMVKSGEKEDEKVFDEKIYIGTSMGRVILLRKNVNQWLGEEVTRLGLHHGIHDILWLRNLENSSMHGRENRRMRIEENEKIEEEDLVNYYAFFLIGCEDGFLYLYGEKENNAWKRIWEKRIHQSDLCGLIWDKEQKVFYCGDKEGNIYMGETENGEMELIFQMETRIIQMEALGDQLLLSSITKTVLLDNIKQTATQIGKKIRKGQYGACFIENKDDNQRGLVIVRPNEKIWIADKNGEIVDIIYFQDENIPMLALVSLKRVDVIKKIQSNHSISINFGLIIDIGSEKIVLWDRSQNILIFFDLHEKKLIGMTSSFNNVECIKKRYLKRNECSFWAITDNGSRMAAIKLISTIDFGHFCDTLRSSTESLTTKHSNPEKESSQLDRNNLNNIIPLIDPTASADLNESDDESIDQQELMKVIDQLGRQSLLNGWDEEDTITEKPIIEDEFSNGDILAPVHFIISGTDAAFASTENVTYVKAHKDDQYQSRELYSEAVNLRDCTDGKISEMIFEAQITPNDDKSESLLKIPLLPTINLQTQFPSSENIQNFDRGSFLSSSDSILTFGSGNTPLQSKRDSLTSWDEEFLLLSDRLSNCSAQEKAGILGVWGDCLLELENIHRVEGLLGEEKFRQLLICFFSSGALFRSRALKVLDKLVEADFEHLTWDDIVAIFKISVGSPGNSDSVACMIDDIDSFIIKEEATDFP